MIVVHAGNRIDDPSRPDPRFPVENQDAVYQRLVALLDTHQPSGVVSAAAAGSDLLILCAAQELDISTHIVLPLRVGRFRAESVSDQGEEWTRRYSAAIDWASSIRVDDLAGDDEWYITGNDVILQRAAEVARIAPDPRVEAIVVKRPEDETSVTADFARKASNRSWVVTEIDPLNP